MSWPKWLTAILTPKQWIPGKCLVCQLPLKEYNQGRLYECANGHQFGKDGKRVDLINAGDHHGPI